MGVAGASTFAMSLKGVSGSGVLDLCSFDTAYHCVSCAYTAANWSRCFLSFTSTVASPLLIIGNIGVSNGLPRAASSVYIVNIDTQFSAGGLSYINTNYTGAGVGSTRATESCVGVGCP
jgi:hypothetical protein